MSDFYGSDLNELAQEEGFDPRSGKYIVRRWEGTPTAVAGKSVELALFGVAYDISELEEGGHQLIRARYGASDTQDPNAPLADTWSLVGNDLEKSLWELPKYQAEFDKFTQTWQLAALKNDIEKYLSGNTETINREPDGSGTAEADLTLEYILNGVDAAGLDRDIIEGLIKALAKGVEAKPISQFALRRVTTVASNTTIRPAYVGVNKVISTTSLQNGGDPGAGFIPSTILFDLPDGYWLKRTPTVEQVSPDKWQITQEWWHADSYESNIYETYG